MRYRKGCNMISRIEADGGRRHAFSLVELLVVISIITLLTAFVLPGLSRAREYAYFCRCKSNLRQVGLGFLVYTGDNKGRLPEGYSWCKSTMPKSAAGGVRYGGNPGFNWNERAVFFKNGGGNLIRQIETSRSRPPNTLWFGMLTPDDFVCYADSRRRISKLLEAFSALQVSIRHDVRFGSRAWSGGVRREVSANQL
jgi:prepilin-type N-terminal cleavage/methylation domain-containing protein